MFGRLDDRPAAMPDGHDAALLQRANDLAHQLAADAQRSLQLDLRRKLFAGLELASDDPVKNSTEPFAMYPGHGNADALCHVAAAAGQHPSVATATNRLANQPELASMLRCKRASARTARALCAQSKVA